MKEKTKSIYFVIIRNDKILLTLSRNKIWSMPNSKLVESSNDNSKSLLEKEISKQIPGGIGVKNLFYYALIETDTDNVTVALCDLCLSSDNKNLGLDPIHHSLTFQLVLNGLDNENKNQEAEYTTHWIDLNKINMKLSGISEEIINQLNIEKINQKFNQS